MEKAKESFETADDPLTHAIIGAVIQVSSWAGPGLLESAYQRCLVIELAERGLTFRAQALLPFEYRGVVIGDGFRPDLIVEEKVIVEAKATARLIPAHQAQLITYLRLSGIRIGLLINFHEFPIRNGIKRFVV